MVLKALPVSSADVLPQVSSTDQDGCSDNDFLAERNTLLLLLHPSSAWPLASRWGSSDSCTKWQSLMDLTGFTVVAAEVSYVRMSYWLRVAIMFKI